MKISTLEKLQRAVFERLRALPELKSADICARGLSPLPDGGRGECSKIEVCAPFPTAASKYTAGPAFSEVSMSIAVSRDNLSSAGAPSALSLAEVVSENLHNWLAPAETGYGRMSLCENAPWQEIKSPPNVSAMAINFKIQSVLQ